MGHGSCQQLKRLQEMLPIVDKPTIQFIVEEAKASGIKDIQIEGKGSVYPHHLIRLELEQNLKQG